MWKCLTADQEFDLFKISEWIGIWCFPASSSIFCNFTTLFGYMESNIIASYPWLQLDYNIDSNIENYYQAE